MIWPFKKHMEYPVQIGQRFKYFGLEMICTGHYRNHITFDYVGNDGILRHGRFFIDDWKIIEIELSRNRAFKFSDLSKESKIKAQQIIQEKYSNRYFFHLMSADKKNECIDRIINESNYKFTENGGLV